MGAQGANESPPTSLLKGGRKATSRIQRAPTLLAPHLGLPVWEWGQAPPPGGKGSEPGPLLLWPRLLSEAAHSRIPGWRVSRPRGFFRGLSVPTPLASLCGN